MITTRDIEALGFVLDDKWNDAEQWIYELEASTLLIMFSDYGKNIELLIYESDLTASVILKGEVTLERIKKLIEALR